MPAAESQCQSAFYRSARLAVQRSAFQARSAQSRAPSSNARKLHHFTVSARSTFHVNELCPAICVMQYAFGECESNAKAV